MVQTQIRCYYKPVYSVLYAPVNDFKEVALQKFFEEKILFGCEYKKNFIEVIYEEKKLRVSINKKEKFVDFQDPKELKDLFDRESSRMLNSQKTKVRMSKTTILFISGLILLVVNFITFFISLHFFEKKSIDRLVAPIFLIDRKSVV